MANCDGGVVASAFCFVSSCFTFALGIGYIISKILNITLLFESCDFFDEDCNHQWRTVFTLNPEVILDMWTPFIFGLLGISIHIKALQFCPMVTQFLPVTYVQYAIFMIMSALFACIGYMGQAGVIVGIVCLIAAIMCVVVRLLGEVYLKAVGLPK
mmetsp:Transcript_101405/g.160346  ORF Transcript_101405/g.160346 Transcript_101405/m.160346 type:complete len:156 (+) Transcript_101405:79-546(+)